MKSLQKKFDRKLGEIFFHFLHRVRQFQQQFRALSAGETYILGSKIGFGQTIPISHQGNYEMSSLYALAWSA
jgi:hypothetical protein